MHNSKLFELTTQDSPSWSWPQLPSIVDTAGDFERIMAAFDMMGQMIGKSCLFIFTLISYNKQAILIKKTNKQTSSNKTLNIVQMHW